MDNGVKSKKKFDHLRLDFEQMKAFRNKFEKSKAKSDNVSWNKAFFVYMWIFTWQLFTKVGYGRARKQDVFKQISEDLIEPKPNVVVNALIRAGMVVWGKSEYNGVTNFCLQCTYLNKNAKTEQTEMRDDESKCKQEMQIEYEKPENAVRVESSAEADADMGERYQYGMRFYYDEAGEMVQVPLAAPSRPTRTAVWDRDTEAWYEPENLPYVEPEF